MFSANTSQIAAGGGAVFVEDIFSTYLYTGNSSTQTITNGIDLSTKGGLVWIKSRASSSYDHQFVDTTRGSNKYINSNNTNAETTNTNRLTAFNTNGFALGASAQVNEAPASGYAATYASWTFRKQKKFFDVVTYTGTGIQQSISHNLGSTPGFIVTKSTSSGFWRVWTNALTVNEYLTLNATDAKGTYSGVWGTTAPNSTSFQVGTGVDNNTNGETFVAYLFAHNAGGFGLTGTDNVISCGSYTGTGSPVDVNLGYEAQWVLIKRTDSTGNWYLMDTMRGMSMTNALWLYPNTSGAEVDPTSAQCNPTATGFTISSTGSGLNAGGATYIYIAIRRGPMKVPTSGTSVYAPVLKSAGNTSAQEFNAGFPPDMVLNGDRNTSASFQMYLYDRLRGVGSSAAASVQIPYLQTPSTAAEATNPYFYLGQNGFGVNLGPWNDNMVLWHFRRAPSFFDEVCYTGNATARTINHNLTVVPELIIVRNRSTGNIWATYAAPIGQRVLQLQSNAASFSSTYWNSTDPTSTVFSVGTSTPVNASGVTFVAYLFATCAGVSKVGSYTGNGTTQTINCGFTGGARFVLIKNNAAGDWYVYDTARGMTVLTDPYLLLNSTAAETATLGSVTTVSTGFALNAAVLADINTNGDTYIFLAIA